MRDREPESRRPLQKREGHRAGCWIREQRATENDREVEYDKEQRQRTGQRDEAINN